MGTIYLTLSTRKKKIHDGARDRNMMAERKGREGAGVEMKILLQKVDTKNSECFTFIVFVKDIKFTM